MGKLLVYSPSCERVGRNFSRSGLVSNITFIVWFLIQVFDVSGSNVGIELPTLFALPLPTLLLVVCN